MPSHYDTLQVIASASDAVIKAAYRALAQLYHPDLNPDNTQAEALMKDINYAYQILSNTSSRAQYDIQQNSRSYANDVADSFSAAETATQGQTEPASEASVPYQTPLTQTIEPPQYLYPDAHTAARPPSWTARIVFFIAAAIFSLMAAAKWMVTSDPGLANSAHQNAMAEIKLRLDTAPLSVPEF